MSTTPAPTTVPVTPATRPVLLGDRLAAVRHELSGGFATVVLVLVLGLAFLLAGLRPTTAAFTDDGVAYEARCGIETVLAGSDWQPLDAACGESRGLRLLATAGGVVLLLGGLVQVAAAAARRSADDEPGPARKLLASPVGRTASVGIVVASAVAVGAALVDRARVDAATLTGSCTGAECADRSGIAGAVLLVAVLAVAGFALVLLWPVLRTRSTRWRAGAGLLAAAVVLVALAARPAGVSAGDDLRGTCGVEVLIAGHPQSSVTEACRDAMAGRPVLGVVALLAAAAGTVLVRTGAGRPQGDASEQQPSPPGAPRPRRARTQPLMAREVDR